MLTCGWLLGKVVQIGLPNIISAGDGSLLSIGVARRLRRAISMFFPEALHFLIKDLTVLTECSTRPFERGYLGDEVTCCIPHEVHISAYCFPAYCGPLSDITTAGAPSMLNVREVRLAIAVLVVEFSL